MKTMNKIILWTMAAFAFLFASCAGEEEVTTPANPLKNKLINVDVLVSDIKTRAGYDTDNLPTQFYLTIDQRGEDNDYTNVVMKHEDGKWVAYESDASDANKVEMHWAGSEGNNSIINSWRLQAALKCHLQPPLYVNEKCRSEFISAV